MLSKLLPHVFSHIFQTMHAPSRISQRSRTDPTLVARSSSAPAHTRAARETRAVRRDRETVAAQTPWYVSRFGDASRLPLPARTLRDARGGVRRSQRPPSVALFLSATASARSKRRSMRIGARSRHDLCSADDARAGRRVRASGTRLDARDAFRTLPLTRAFSLAPPISPFAIRDRRSSSLASSQLALPLIADRQLKPRPAVRRAGQDVHRGGVRRAVLRVRDRAR
jgi:hypothetical protein